MKSRTRRQSQRAGLGRFCFSNLAGRARLSFDVGQKSGTVKGLTSRRFFIGAKVPIGVVMLFVFALFGKALPLAHAADGMAPDIKVLPPIVIQGKFSEFVCGARFRYHIPGNNLKELVLKKIPKSWEKAGVSIGDSIISIDGQAIDGLGIVALGKYLHPKPKTGTFDFTCGVRSKKTKTVQRIEANFERDTGAFAIVYP